MDRLRVEDLHRMGVMVDASRMTVRSRTGVRPMTERGKQWVADELIAGRLPQTDVAEPLEPGEGGGK